MSSTNIIYIITLTKRLLIHKYDTKTLFKVYVSTTPSQSDSMVTPNPKKITSDMIGPADPVSNLRRVIFKSTQKESALEKRYRILRGDVQEWNQSFWTQHNTKFYQEREAFLKRNLPEGQQVLTADEMSVFYKAFLDRNWKSHVHYNIEWYKKNVTLLGLAIRIKIKNMFSLKKMK